MQAAIAAGYAKFPDQTGDCVAQPGQGAMGVHYLNGTLVGDTVLFGHPFHLVRSPNRYGVPSFYELHLWVWEHNRNGIFNDWNPKVRCP